MMEGSVIDDESAIKAYKFSAFMGVLVAFLSGPTHRDELKQALAVG
jgi:hypothetical protein